MMKTVVEGLERISPNSWRRIFVVYYIALTIGTHWPDLRLGPPGPIPVDKIMHALAFCGAAGFLMLTRWCERSLPAVFNSRNIRRSAVIALLLAAADELTQIVPGQGRFATWQDFAANVLGIAIAVLVALTLFKPASTTESPR